MNESPTALATIEDGKVPSTRMDNASTVQDFVRRMSYADERRSRKRALVNGLVDGKPPYKISKLKAAGRAESANVNWNVGKAYCDAGNGAFYDLVSEAPGYISIRTNVGEDAEHIESYSRTMSQEADRVLMMDDVWDYEIQQSQWDMVLHGCGPLMFEDAVSVLPRAFQCGDLKVPERTKSDTKYWDAAVIISTYYPPQLYEFIKDAEAATAVGWNVAHTRSVIENAMNLTAEEGQPASWEFYQAQLKNNSLAYYDDTKICRLAHVYWKEFSGRITHVIVERETTAEAGSKGAKFLFRGIDRYPGWKSAIHPMYYDRGNGGFHHSVTGMGVKMYGAMEFQNRLLCNLADKAFAPKILFKPTSTEAAQKFEIQNLGDMAVVSKGFDWEQTGVAGLMQEGIAMNREITGLVRSNLASYQEGPMKREGNPVTAKQVMYDAQQQSALSKTQFNRYYKQLDILYSEIVRRLCNLNSSDERAQEFQKRCAARGVRKECFGRLERVEAVRIVGQGSSFMRRASVDALIPISGALPEAGRANLMKDKIAAEAGQAAVNRYWTPGAQSEMATDQEERATSQIAGMMTGVAPVITSSQNPVTFAALFLKSAVQMLESIQQGKDPNTALAFIELAGPAIAAHLARFSSDPSRKTVYMQMLEQWKKLSVMADKLADQIQESSEQQQAQAGKTQQTMSDEQLKVARLQSDIQLKTAKTQAQLSQSEQKHRLKLAQQAQEMEMADAAAASEIYRQNSKAAADEE